MPPKAKKNKFAEEKERCAEEAKKAEASEMRKKEKLDNIQDGKDKIAEAENAVKVEEEVKRLGVQTETDMKFLEYRDQSIKTMQAEVKENEDWEKYLECNPLPDVEKENQLNTYLSKYRAYDDIEDLLQNPHKYIQKIVDYCCESEQVISLMQSVEGKAREDGDQAQLDWCQDYYKALRDITNEKLDKLTMGYLHVADEYEDDQQVVNTCYGTPDIKYGCWVHTSARGRVKSINFADIHVEINLPVALQKSRTCIRAIQCDYDHFSVQTLRDAQRIAMLPEVEEEEEPLKDGKKKKKKKKKNKKKPAGEGGGPFFVSVGGVVNIQQCGLPPPPKRLKRWTMREITALAESIVTYPYPSHVDPQSTNTQAPAYIQYKIPDTLYIHDGKPQFGWWNDETDVWETDGISGTKYDPETRIANFGIITLKPFSVIQPRCYDFPYSNWSVCPNGFGKCLVNVQGSRFDVQFEVVGGKVQLLHPTDKVLQHINNTLLDPGVLLTRMAGCGINLIPTDHDAKFCRKPIKKDLEAYLHSQISMICALFDVKGCRWNGSRGVDKCMFQVKLSEKDKRAIDHLPPPNPNAVEEKSEEKPAEPVETEGGEEEGATVEDTGIVPIDVTEQRCDSTLFALAVKQKVFLTQSTDEEVDEEILFESVPHVSLRRVLAVYYDRQHVQKGVGEESGTDIQMSEAVAMMDEQALHLQETVKRLLTLLRPLTFY